MSILIIAGAGILSDDDDDHLGRRRHAKWKNVYLEKLDASLIDSKEKRGNLHSLGSIMLATARQAIHGRGMPQVKVRPIHLTTLAEALATTLGCSPVDS